VTHKRVGTEHARGAGGAAAIRPTYLHSTLRQTVLLALAGPVLYLTVGAGATLSLLCGAACALVPQAWFALRMHRAVRESATRAARRSLVAEAGKFGLSAVAFATVFAVIRPPQPLLVFVGFGALWLLQIGDSVRLLRRSQR